MPKPLSGQSGSGMHIHTSLNRGGVNQFGQGADGEPNELMGRWTAGLVAHAASMSLVGIPLPNGYRRVRPYTFCPTHAHWGEDNRTVMARLTTNQGSANRVEFRCAGADANPYLAIAAVLAAGCDGVERTLPLPPKAVGDMYTEPGNSPELPTSMQSAIDLFRSSPLAAQLGQGFSDNFVVLCTNEIGLATEPMQGDPDLVTEWERQRYIEHT
jgi:glutamine synthetase